MLEFTYRDGATPELRRIAAYIPNASKAGNKAVAQMAAGVLRGRIQRIYERQIPLSPTGRKMWQRTGALKRSPQKAQVSRDGFLIRFGGVPALPIRGYAGGYAQRRSELGVTWFPQNASGTRRRPDRALVRKNDFIGDTQRHLDVHGPAVWETAFTRELKIK